MDSVFSVLFHPSEDALWEIEQAFDYKFGLGVWESEVAAYFSFPGLLFSAPNTVYVVWIINYVQDQLGCENLYDYFEPPCDVEACPGCKREFRAESLFRLNYTDTGPLCAECNSANI